MATSNFSESYKVEATILNPLEMVKIEMADTVDFRKSG